MLEELVPAWVSAHGTLNVVLGPVFDNDTDSLLDDISRLRYGGEKGMSEEHSTRSGKIKKWQIVVRDMPSLGHVME